MAADTTSPRELAMLLRRAAAAIDHPNDPDGQRPSLVEDLMAAFSVARKACQVHPMNRSPRGIRTVVPDQHLHDAVTAGPPSRARTSFVASTIVVGVMANTAIISHCHADATGTTLNSG